MMDIVLAFLLSLSLLSFGGCAFMTFHDPRNGMDWWFYGMLSIVVGTILTTFI